MAAEPLGLKGTQVDLFFSRNVTLKPDDFKCCAGTIADSFTWDKEMTSLLIVISHESHRSTKSYFSGATTDKHVGKTNKIIIIIIISQWLYSYVCCNPLHPALKLCKL